MSFSRATSCCLSQCWTLCCTPEIGTSQKMVWVSHMCMFQPFYLLIVRSGVSGRSLARPTYSFLLMEHSEPIPHSGLLFSRSIKQTLFILIGGFHTDWIDERWVSVCVCFPCRDILSRCYYENGVVLNIVLPPPLSWPWPLKTWRRVNVP